MLLEFISFNVCFICILNCVLLVCKLFILYVCVTQRLSYFKEKRYINMYYYYVTVCMLVKILL